MSFAKSGWGKENNSSVAIMTDEVKNITLEAFSLLHVDHLIKNHTGVDDKNAMINQNDGEWFENEWVVSEISSNTTKPMFDYDMSVRVVMLSVLLGVQNDTIHPHQPHPELIFVTNITNYIGGEKTGMWRNFSFLYRI